ncbi:uncharacterized protein IL334_000164 [Kwoniella shivajii]|uniref:Csf1 N-terminal domain-containing protein n=1 Tax=Kwoniella shivajii TaxID=564305 RepID=A0ABZ1CRF2_9TREE|nr:hypothetical protein IL334_000164 [Kwoniella shivajii]
MSISERVNLLLLIELAAVVIAASAFLFYWNRLFGSIVAYFIRLYTWRNYNAHIIIGSLQIAPIAGRISFRDVEYHSSNLSVRALHGHVTWRYWKLRIRHETDSESFNPKRNKLPCRITVFAEGVEGFVYNRTPAYDAIVERMKKHERDESGFNDKKSPRTSDDTNTDNDSTLRSRLKKVTKSSVTGSTSTNAATSENGLAAHQYPPESDHHNLNLLKPTVKPAPEGVNWFREALPLDIRIGTGSIVLGSDATPMVLIGDFKRAEGTLEVTDSRSSLDLYKMSANLIFHHASVLMRTNVDYSGPLLAHGKKVYDELLKRKPDLTSKPPSALSVFTGFQLLSKQFKFLYNSKFSTPPVAGLPTDKIWKGLARYRDLEDGETKGPKREEREYAKVTNLLETRQLEFTYYADTPGLVPHPPEAPYVDDQDQVGNVDLPPEYGIDIVIHKDREAIQRAFAPSLFFDSEPKPRLRPGDTRMHTTLILHLSLEDETVMRIPTREPSKDWQFDNAAVDMERRYGWLDVVVGPNSAISYTQDQVATQQGYDSILVLQLDSLGISSSVNLDTFIKAKTCKVSHLLERYSLNIQLSMTMPTPLEWDAQRDWGMDVTLDMPSISLLRDHVTLISDLAKDWSSGASVGDYHHFVPNHYNFRVSLINYAFHLYINDYNIVDAPWSRDSNVTSTQYRPEFSIVPFSVSLDDAKVELCVPKWDTHRAFGPDAFEVGKIGSIKAKGSYLYYSVPRPDHQETLDLHLEVSQAYKEDNYFGSFTQFRTMQEYLEKFDHDPVSVGDPVEEKYRPGRSDPFAVIVTMNVEDSLILMSDGIYDFDAGLVIPVPQMQMNLKSVEYFMELSLDVTPTCITASPELNNIYAQGTGPKATPSDVIFIEGIEVKANRLFGPKPLATTYLCLWEIAIPKISAFLGPDLLANLQSAGRSIGYTFPDIDNSPADIYVPKTYPDVTFLKVKIDELIGLLTADHNAISFEASNGLSLDTSTLGAHCYSSMLAFVLPTLRFNVLERDVKKTWRSVAAVNADAIVDVYKAPKGWKGAVARQQEFLRQEDAETGRIWYMYQEVKPNQEYHIDGLYVPYPMDQAIADDKWIEEESDRSTLTSEDAKYGSSSADSSESETPYNDFDRMRLRKRRSRSFATARETPDTSSAGDESDSMSSTTSGGASAASGGDKDLGDMASIMAAKLRGFRSAHTKYEPLPASSTKLGSDERVNSAPRRPVEDGTIVRISGQAINLDLTPPSALVVSNILTGLSTGKEGHAKRLDALLIGHLEAAESESTIVDAKILDVRLPTITVRLSSGQKHASSLFTQLTDLNCNLYHYAPRGNTSVLDVASSISSITVVGSTSTLPDISINDVSEVDELSGDGVPLFRLAVRNLVVDLHKSQGLRLHNRISNTSLDMVTASINTMSSLIRPWQLAIQNICSSKPSANADARMLYTIMKRVVENGYDTYLPAFAFERAYGLHVQDFRNIRTQTGWWLLARFREWSRRMPAEQSVDDDISLEQMADYVVAQLCKVEDTVHGAEHIIRGQHFIQSVFGPVINTAPNKKDQAKAMDLFLYSENLRIKHHGYSIISKIVNTSYISIKKASLGGSQIFGKADDRPVSQVQAIAAIGEISTRFHDSMFPLCRDILDVLPPTASKEAPVDSSAKEEGSTLVINGQVDVIDINMMGGDLRLHFGMQQSQLTQLARESFHQHNQPPHKSSKISLNTTCNMIELSLHQVDDQTNLSGNSMDRVILLLKAEGLKALLDNYQSNRKLSAPEVKVLLGLKMLDLDSRPQLRAFHAFVQEWKKKELP